MHVEDCICELAAPLSLATRVALVMHRRETKKPTNTGRLAELSIAGTRRFVRGHREDPADLTELLDPDRRVWLLFPRDDARVVTPADVAADRRPVTLVVPDGTWPQARRAVAREPVLAEAPAYLPPPGPRTTYGLRKEHVEGGLATFEAIVRMLAVIEGDDVADQLQRWFDVMVARMTARRRGGAPEPWDTPDHRPASSDVVD